MRSINLIATLAATATLGVAATADASTFCVGSPASCPAGATSSASLDAALEAADSNAGYDLVRIGTGTFKAGADGFDYLDTVDPLNTVEILGEGDGTVLTTQQPAMAAGMSVLELRSKGPSRVANLKIVVPGVTKAGVDTRGLTLIGNAQAEKVTITDSGAETLGASSGIELSGGSVLDSSVVMNDQATAIEAKNSDPSSVIGTTLRGQYGIRATALSVVLVRRANIRATLIGATVRGGTMSVESSVVHVTGEDGVALRSQGLLPNSAHLKASHVTAIGAGIEDTSGVLVNTGDDADAQVSIDNSIIQGFERGLRRSSTDVGGQGEAKVVGANVNYDAANDYSAGAGEFALTNVTNLAPGFVNAAAGDFRLAATSAMIGKGRDASYVVLTGKDLAGKARTVATKRDLGAYEYQAAAPVAAIGGSLAGEPGAALALSAGGSIDPDGDPITGYKWSFGDGTEGTGKDVSHAWGAAGTYEVKLTVTDSTGKSSTAVAQVVVAEKPVEQQGGGENGGGTNGGGGQTGGGTNGGGVTPPADTTAPAITKLGRSGANVRVTLSEAATLTVRVEKQAAKRKFRAAGAAKRFTGKAGANTLKRAVRRLAPGRYRLVVTAVDAAGNRSVKRLSFRVR